MAFTALLAHNSIDQEREGSQARRFPSSNRLGLSHPCPPSDPLPPAKYHLVKVPAPPRSVPAARHQVSAHMNPWEAFHPQTTTVRQSFLASDLEEKYLPASPTFRTHHLRLSSCHIFWSSLKEAFAKICLEVSLDGEM